ncbi:E3 ubiquitin-protein ligase FANCL isoform X1 [Tripterygium wilfordii]|uniref:E3 ubiquitin-protein ligase FANCL isoform X1 n=1 Tax=Tripterygium wilfordii TaxID=458696 RepID=A0A7J7DLY5_TRIWF|nr:E3 ubiquitin-protein ligase FANCL isoform X1 [Tripterygium wilfordii]
MQAVGQFIFILPLNILRDRRGWMGASSEVGRGHDISKLSNTDLPCIPNLEWSRNSRLKDLVQQFQEHVDKFQEFWSILDDIDKSLWVIDLNKPSHAISSRQINIGNDCFIMLFINPNDPRSLPEYRFIGPLQSINSLTKIWQKNSKRWTKERPFLENLTFVLETQLPRPADVQMNDQQDECGICYAQCLPIDDELGTKLEIVTDYICDNSSCSKAFHSICLAEWLRSITTTRQSFNVLFGKCPYCSEPVAVKIDNAKK